MSAPSRALRYGCMLLLAALLPACSKVGDFQRQRAEFRQECFGDHSVRCRVMMVDVGIAELEAGIEVLEQFEDKIVACRDQAAFDAGVALVREKIEHFDDMKPNRFMRIFMSGMEVEFDQTPFKRQRELDAFEATLASCRKGGPAAAESAAVATPPPAQAPLEPDAQGAIDANAPDAGAILTVAGTLVKTALDNGSTAITLDGRVLFSGEDATWQTPLRKFTLSGNREAVLVGSSGGRGNSCETLFFFMIAEPGGIRHSPTFGTCAPNASFVQSGDRITLAIPKMGGHSQVVFDGGAITEDGALLTLGDNNDPSK